MQKGKKDMTQNTNKMVNVNPTLPVITLNMNGLNIPIKRQRLSDGIKSKYKNKKKQDPTIYVFLLFRRY